MRRSQSQPHNTVVPGHVRLLPPTAESAATVAAAAIPSPGIAAAAQRPSDSRASAISSASRETASLASSTAPTVAATANSAAPVGSANHGLEVGRPWPELRRVLPAGGNAVLPGALPRAAHGGRHAR